MAKQSLREITKRKFIKCYKGQQIVESPEGRWHKITWNCHKEENIRKCFFSFRNFLGDIFLEIWGMKSNFLGFINLFFSLN